MDFDLRATGQGSGSALGSNFEEGFGAVLQPSRYGSNRFGQRGLFFGLQQAVQVHRFAIYSLSLQLHASRSPVLTGP